MKFLTLIASIAFFLTGCASTIFQARTDRTGDFFLRDSVKTNPHTPRLYIETAPDEFELNRGKVSYDKIRYEYIGRIYVKRDFENWRIGFVDFNEPWRQYYCPPVVTLTYVTGLVPLHFTPLPYFCWYENSSSSDRIEQRKKYMSLELLKEGKRVGATHIVFATYTGLEYPDGGGNASTVDNERALNNSGSRGVDLYTGMVAHAFRRKSAKE